MATLTKEQIAAAAARLDGGTPQDILRWAVDAPRDLLARTAAVVTLDSPLQGLGDVPAEMSDLVTRWVTTQLCADRRVLDELTPGRAEGPLAALGRSVYCFLCSCIRGECPPVAAP